MAHKPHGSVPHWRSPDGIRNAEVLRTQYRAAFSAISEIDALGHRVLKRAGDAGPAEGVDRIVGLALLSQAVTGYVGLRHLFEASVVQSALLVARTQFEIYLAVRYLIHGGRQRLSLGTPTARRSRESRARYFMASEIRTEIYRRQAMLDGRDGAMRARRKEVRVALKAEVSAELQRLERHFRPQQRRFGPLRCFHELAEKRRYYDPKPWFSFGFPSGTVGSLRSLARHMGVESHYFLLYDPISGLNHARSISHSLTIAGAQAQIHSPYNPAAFAGLAYWTSSWQILTIASAAKAYCATAFEDLQKTHLKVRPLLDSIEKEAAGMMLG